MKRSFAHAVKCLERPCATAAPMLKTLDSLLQPGDVRQRDMILELTDKAMEQFYQVARRVEI